MCFAAWEEQTKYQELIILHRETSIATSLDQVNGIETSVPRGRICADACNLAYMISAHAH